MNHLSEQQIQEYIDQRLSAPDLIDLTDHLTICASCGERLQQFLINSSTIDSLHRELTARRNEFQLHLNFDQLTGFLEHDLEDVEREIVKSHLEICYPCYEGVRDLFAFRYQLLNPDFPLRDSESEFFDLLPNIPMTGTGNLLGG